jgi:hypothetical protein
MPTIRVYGDEFYPVYYEDDYTGPGSGEVELTDEEYTFFKRATNKFWRAQEMIQKKLKESRG